MATLALVVAVSTSGVPAMADPVASTSASVVNQVKRALKIGQVANKRAANANKRSIHAIRLARRTEGGPQGPAGPRGERGPTGPQGATGPSTGPAGGDLDGSYPDPSIAASAVSHGKLSSAARPRWVLVDHAGAISRDRGAVSAANLANGEYEVIFDRDVTDCAHIVQIGVSLADIPAPVFQQHPTGAPAMVGATLRLGKPKGIYVETFDADGNAENRGFHLLVAC